MTFGKHIFDKITARRALAFLACLALFYFAAGGANLHEHKDGRGDTPCHVCQALHMPALAAAGAASVPAPEFVSWYLSQPVHSVPSEAFSIHHAGRAPPRA
ncbi:MAG: hypothetical protein JSS69_00240 [Acidobacteria bacterium]|nr:hypothetical protein [Acidobacteriota bacterium]MBS1864321.1 hypothetical protein [Acidobacteriota bacterium]